jgi:hypothetical protein
MLFVATCRTEPSPLPPPGQANDQSAWVRRRFTLQRNITILFLMVALTR